MEIETLKIQRKRIDMGSLKNGITINKRIIGTEGNPKIPILKSNKQNKRQTWCEPKLKMTNSPIEAKAWCDGDQHY